MNQSFAGGYEFNDMSEDEVRSRQIAALPV